jgi:hypothetical protein
MEDLELMFGVDGRVRTLYSDAAASLVRVIGGVLDTRRASDVEPDGEGWSAWIREWVPGGAVKLGPFDTRAAALEAEVAYLRVQLTLA